jgi:hypothetical protein
METLIITPIFEKQKNELLIKIPMKYERHHKRILL